MCFRRISWGHGSQVMYFDVNVHVRRIAADFTRRFISNIYRIPIPQPFLNLTDQLERSREQTESSLSLAGADISAPAYYNLTSNSSGSSLVRHRLSENRFVIDGHPMRITLYTRGSSGRGRTIQGENKLMEHLNSLGAIAAICCDFSKTSMEDQIGYAYYADAVIGLHGQCT
jgi:hypothetical protein